MFITYSIFSVHECFDKKIDCHGFGVDLIDKSIDSLLFVDDIVLMAKSEDELQSILDIAYEF